MTNIRLPEATLIDIKRISRDCQSKLSAKINYSDLFDLSEDYKYAMKPNLFSVPLSCLGYGCEDAIGYTLTKSFNSNECFLAINSVQAVMHMDNTKDFCGICYSDSSLTIRPVFRYSEIQEYSTIIKEIKPGYLIVTFGEYPTSICFWNNRKPIPTGNKYTLVIFDEKTKDKEIKEFPEVTFEEIDGKYVIKDDKIYIVEPIYFLVDVKKDFAISRDIMFGLPTLVDPKTARSYKETLPYEFLNTYFVPELMQSITKQNEKEIKSEENPLFKEKIDIILSLIANTCIEDVIKEELQGFINEYNNDLENEKNKKEDEGLTLTISKTPDVKLIEKLQFLTSKIKNFPYYNESKVIFSCLHLEKKLEIESTLYKDIFTIFNYILPILPKNIRKEYQEQLRKILKCAQDLIIKLYDRPNIEKVNIELEVRKRLQPVLEELSKDVATNYIDINLKEIIKGIFKASSDKYQANLFELINSIVREIEILIESNKLEGYHNKLIELLNNDNPKSFEYLTKLYIELIKLKKKIEEKLNTNESIERKKVRRKFI